MEGFTADEAADLLASWLLAFAASVELVLLAHSLGCRLAAACARRLARRHRRRGFRLCLMAAALDRDALGREGRGGYRAATEAAAAVHLLVSPDDRVLLWAYPAGDLLESVLSLFALPPGRALGCYGPPADQLERFPALDPHWSHPSCEVDHGDYLPDATGPLSPKEEAAAAFARDVVAGRRPLRWRMAVPCDGDVRSRATEREGWDRPAADGTVPDGGAVLPSRREDGGEAGIRRRG